MLFNLTLVQPIVEKTALTCGGTALLVPDLTLVLCTERAVSPRRSEE